MSTFHKLTVITGAGTILLLYIANTSHFFFFFFHWHYSPLWALACRTMSLHFVLSVANTLRLLTPNTWRSLATFSLHPFLGRPLQKHHTSWCYFFFSWTIIPL